MSDRDTDSSQELRFCSAEGMSESGLRSPGSNAVLFHFVSSLLKTSTAFAVSVGQC